MLFKIEYIGFANWTWKPARLNVDGLTWCWRWGCWDIYQIDEGAL